MIRWCYRFRRNSLSPDKTISPANQQALGAEAAGLHVVICTGRPYLVSVNLERNWFQSNHSYSVINNRFVPLSNLQIGPSLLCLI